MSPPGRPKGEYQRAQPEGTPASLFALVVGRDLRLAARRRVEVLLPIAFFLVAALMFPFGVGPEPQTLRQIAPGVIWACALLAAMLSVNQLYAGDLADGSLEQMLLTGQGGLAVAAAKALAHWLLTGLPLVMTTPLLGLMFGMDGIALAALVASLLLGTPILSLLGGLGAALTLGARSAGVLLIIIILPLCVPAIIFGTGAVGAIESGISPSGHFSLLGALLIATALGAPPVTAAALKVAVE